MRKEDKKLENLLRIKGIHAQGFGTIGKIVMRDRRLSAEAKAIYSYIASFAGSGTTAFPSVEIMVSELVVSETRFYKHRQKLIDLNYIEITRERVGNRFGRNIYELVQNPIPLAAREESPPPAAQPPSADTDDSADKQADEQAKKHKEKNAEATEAPSLEFADKQLFRIFEINPSLKEVFSTAYKNPNFKETAEEVIEAINYALLEADDSGFKFNKRTYLGADLCALFAKLSEEDIISVLTSVHKELGREDIKNRRFYILGCLFNRIEQNQRGSPPKAWF